MKKIVYWPDSENNQYIENRQRAILRRLAPEYNYDSYVLWIFPEIFSKFLTIEGKVHILLKNGEELLYNYIQRYPYPNRHIHQLSRKEEDAIVDGIPLFFKSYADLQDISHLKISWTACFEINGIPTAYVTQTIYEIKFSPSLSPSIYTIGIRDMFRKEPATDIKARSNKKEFIMGFEELYEQIYTGAQNSIKESHYQICKEETQIPLLYLIESKKSNDNPINAKQELLKELSDYQIIHNPKDMDIVKDQYFKKVVLEPYHYGQWLI